MHKYFEVQYNLILNIIRSIIIEDDRNIDLATYDYTLQSEN